MYAGVISTPCPKLGGIEGNCLDCNEKDDCPAYKAATEDGKQLFSKDKNLPPS